MCQREFPLTGVQTFIQMILTIFSCYYVLGCEIDTRDLYSTLLQLHMQSLYGVNLK